MFMTIQTEKYQRIEILILYIKIKKKIWPDHLGWPLTFFPLLCIHVGERLGVVEAQCERLRMLYRDCARPPPPPPPLQIDRRQVRASCSIG